MEKMTLIAACRKHLFFPTEKVKEISVQYKALTEQDKADLKQHFLAIGIDTHEPEPKAQTVVAVA